MYISCTTTKNCPKSPFWIILDRFLIVFWFNFDQSFIKTDGSHWKTKFPKVLMKFDVRIIIFESNYHEKVHLKHMKIMIFLLKFIIFDQFRNKNSPSGGPPTGSHLRRWACLRRPAARGLKRVNKYSKTILSIHVENYEIPYRFFWSFWTVFDCFFDDQSLIKSDESHWKTEFPKVLMKSDIINMFFESNYHEKVHLKHMKIMIFSLKFIIFDQFCNKNSPSGGPPTGSHLGRWACLRRPAAWGLKRVNEYSKTILSIHIKKNYEIPCRFFWSFWTVFDFFLMKFRSKFDKIRWKSLKN